MAGWVLEFALKNKLLFKISLGKISINSIMAAICFLLMAASGAIALRNKMALLRLLLLALKILMLFAHLIPLKKNSFLKNRAQVKIMFLIYN